MRPQVPWFRQKKWGIGWVPANGKGWAVTAFYIALVCLYPISTRELHISVEAWTISLTVILIAVCAWTSE